jgi:hypothetical protein
MSTAPLTPTWIDEARDFTLSYADSYATFTGNDLWAAGLPDTANRRNLSRVLLGLERDGLIVRTGRRVASVGGHSQPILEWRLA